MVDARRGRAVDQAALNALTAFALRKPRFSLGSAIHWGTATRLPDGRMRALVAVCRAVGGRVLVRWTQGRAPTDMPHPAPAGDGSHGLLIPSGDAFLLTRELRPVGEQSFCEV